MRITVHVHGDSTVGIQPTYFDVECPFNREDVDAEELEEFRNGIASLYAEFSDMRVSADYDFELEKRNNQES